MLYSASIEEDDSDVPGSPFDDDDPSTPGGDGVTPMLTDSPFMDSGAASSPFTKHRTRMRNGTLNMHPRNATSMPEMQTVGKNLKSMINAGHASDTVANGADMPQMTSYTRLTDDSPPMTRVWGGDKVEVIVGGRSMDEPPGAGGADKPSAR